MESTVQSVIAVTGFRLQSESAVRLPGNAVGVSIIVPTLNESVNLPKLLERIGRAMARRLYEVLVVDDDSRDGTPEVCAGLAATHPLRLCVRKRPVGGLSGAVLHGFALACGHVLAVMDADLQHPPECLPGLIEPIESGEADMAIGSRYVNGGSVVGEWGCWRRLNSTTATILAKPLTGGVRDPMSGFFAIRRSVWEAASSLNPLGYKIALELLCKCSLRAVKEVPIHFGPRCQGRSKLSTRQQLHFIRHLARLYAFRLTTPSRLRTVRRGGLGATPLGATPLHPPYAIASARGTRGGL